MVSRGEGSGEGLAIKRYLEGVLQVTEPYSVNCFSHNLHDCVHLLKHKTVHQRKRLPSHIN